jgi:hypothetical protein
MVRLSNKVGIAGWLTVFILTFYVLPVIASGQTLTNGTPKGKAESVGRSNEAIEIDADDELEERASQRAIKMNERYVKVHVTVLDPKSVSDIFGRRVGNRYVAVQVTIRNQNQEHQFLIQDVSLDLGNIGKSEKLKVPKGYAPSSNDLTLARGVMEKGQVYDRRNFILRLLRGAGTAAAGLIGVTTLGISYAPSVAMFNGPFVTSFRDTFPDSTVNQLIRLNDSAYLANTLVPKGSSKVMVALLDQAMFMDKKLRKRFREDPMSIIDKIDFRETVAVVHGIFITKLEEKSPLVTAAVIDDGEMERFQDAQPAVRGRIFGRFLIDSALSLTNQEPDGLSVSLDGEPEPNVIKFIIKSNKPVKPDTLLGLLIANSQGAQRATLQVRYQIGRPALNSVDKTEAAQGSAVTLKLNGSNFIRGISNVTVSGGAVEIASLNIDSSTSITLTLKVGQQATLTDREVRVTNGEGLVSEPKQLKIIALSASSR